MREFGRLIILFFLKPFLQLLILFARDFLSLPMHVYDFFNFFFTFFFAVLIILKEAYIL